MNATTETITIEYREEFETGLVVYTIAAKGFRTNEYSVRILNGKADGCTCRNGHCGCTHQDAIARVESEYQSH